MGKLMKSKLLTQIFAVMICFVLIATSVSVSAYAENEMAVERGITIEMTAVDENGNEKETVCRPMGESGTFRLKAENTSVEQQTVSVKIKLPNNLFETDANGKTTHCYIKDFENADFENEVKVSISGQTDIFLINENGEHYLSFSFSEGTTFQHDFLVAFTNGITEPKTVQINKDDITVEQEKTTQVTKSGGAITFFADFAWENVRISSNPTEVQVANGKTKTSIQYTIQNTSLNKAQSGAIFTKEYKILETITLPDYISFPTTGEVTVEAADSGSKIKIGNTVIATVDGKVKEASINEKTLTFKIYYENDQMPPAEVSNPEYKVTLKNLNADVQNIKEFYENAENNGQRLEIINKTQFKATSVFDDVRDSIAEISTPIGNPAEAWSVKKESDHPYIAPGEKIRYTITITNESEFALKKKTYEIADSLSEFLHFVPGSAVLKGYDASGAQFEETLSDSVLTGSSITCSKEMLIPKNGEVKLSFEAVVKEKASSGEPLTDGSEIKNSAVIKADNVSKTTNETTDSYIAGDPERKIKKTAQMMNGKAVIDGSTVLYTITLENSSGLKLPFDVVDELPSYVNPETVKDVQVTYTKGGKTGKAQSLGYNREGRTIRFNKIWLSRTADSNGHRADITFKVNLAGLSGAAKGTAIINKASVKQVDSPGRNLPEISDVAILNSDENKIRISVQKSAQGSPKRDTENEDLYSIDYSISLTNMGKTFTQGDTKNITDIMQGGLMPAKVPTEKGEIKGQYVTGTTTQEITGAYVTNYDQDGKVLSYTITWPINKMEYPKAGAACQEGRIAYTGYAKWENITNIKNSAAIDGSYSDVTVPVTVKPSITKKIYSINGAKTSGGLETKCDIKSGDKIVYEIKVKNTGDFTAKNCTIRDLLPAAAQIDGKSYYSSENVTVTASWNTKGLEFKGTAAHDYSKNELKWTKVDLYPKSELTLMITVQYPKGTSFAEFFLKDDLDESETTNDAILIYKEKTFESKVTHSMKRTKLTIEKSVDTKKVLQTGDNATFTISGFGTQAGVYEYKVVDQLDDIYRLVTLDTLNTGAFEGISKYTLTLTYDKKENGENIKKTIVYEENDCKINHELTADSLKHDTDTSAKVISAEWSFNDGDYVPYLEIKQNPTLKVVVPVGNQPGKGSNKVTVYYDGQDETATAPLAAVNGIALKKSAYVNGKVVQNDTNPIKQGDQVTFRIEYKNIGKEPLALNNANAITDYLSTNGLKASTGYPISAVLFDENGFKASQQGILKANDKTSLEISETDISAATAKKILFTYENGDGSDFMIPSGHVLKISYTVTASDEFENSHWDKKDGKITENWEAKKYENSRIIHNEAKVQSAGQTVKADTGWYYQKGKNKLRIEKGVFAVGYLSKDSTYAAKIKFESIPDLNFWSSKASSAPTNWEDNRYEDKTYKWDVVSYHVTIENDEGSEEALTISKIKENLPENAYDKCVSNWLYAHHKLGTSVILNEGKYSFLKITWPNQNTTNSTPTDIGYTKQRVTNIETNETTKNADIRWDAKNGHFSVKDSKTNKNLELKPGERVTFNYHVVVDRRNTDPLKWSNTAALCIEDTDAEFQINEELKQKAPIKSLSAKRNDGDCKKVGETQFSSTVDIYSLGNRTGIKKTSSGLYAAAKAENLGASTTLTDINNIDTNDKTAAAADKVYAKIANNKKVTFNDIVEWKLEVKNQGAKQKVRITDELPYPYEAIIDGSAVMQRYDTSSETWKDVEGTITTKTGGTFGTASQEIKAEIDLPAASTTTLRVLARYAGEKSKQYFSRNYRNNVKLEALNSAGNVTTISGVVEGTAQYNQNKQITAITAQDYVYPTIGAETTSVKSITNSNGKTARGDIKELNYVTTPSAGDKVRYTLEVTNNSTGNLKNFVLIDKLPQIGDTGNLDTTTGRGTEFQMKLPTNPNITVKVGNNDVTNQVSVTYKNVEPNAAFSVDDWNGHGSNWENAATAPDRGNITAIRINMDGIEVSNKEKIIVSFDAIVGDNAVAGQIAWNTFGYAYTSALKEDMRLYAEPAKVGVKVSGKEIAVKKIWKGSTLSSRPSLTEGLTITVIGKTASGEKKVEKTYTGQAISWEEDASGKVWNAVISGLPIQVDGQELTYSITETSPTGYRQQGEIVKSEDSDNGLTQFTITNTQTKQISGLKVWNDGKETHDNPKLILQKLINGKWADVNLQEEGITLKWEEATLGDVGLTTGNDGIKHVQKYTFENLAADYIYKVDEATLNGYKSEEDGSKFTNTLLTNISVSKVWKDQDRTERPAVNVNLLSNGFVTAEKELSIANGWKAEFKELPVYDENGTKIVYTVEETKIDGYRAVIKTILNENGTEFEITNILAADVNISGQKYWYDSNNQYESRPDSVTLKILQNDEEFKTIQVYASDRWRFEVKGLPRYDENGKDYNYSITEDRVNQYTNGVIEKTSETEDANGNKILKFEISNTYQEPNAIDIPLEFWKKLTDRDTKTAQPIGAGKFNFKVTYKNDEGVEIRKNVSNTASTGEDNLANVAFVWEGISEPGEYVFTITEEDVDSAYINIDTDPITATVTVTRPKEGDNLKIDSITYSKQGKTLAADEKPLFENELIAPQPVTVQPVLKKILLRGAIADKQFSFKLENRQGTPEYSKIVQADSDGKIAFGEIKYTEAGDYEYTISEIPGNDANIKYDSREIRMLVRVTAESTGEGDNKEVTLNAKTYYIRDGEVLTEEQPAFTNIQYAEVSTDLSIYKTIKDNAKELKENQFEFALYDETGKELDKAKNDASGKVVFTNIDGMKYSYADVDKTFIYTIKEVEGNLAGYQYSSEAITAKVTVRAGADNNLHTDVGYFNKNGEQLTNPSITNTYESPDSITAELGVKKEYVNAESETFLPIDKDQFSFVLTAQNHAPMPGAAEDEDSLTVTTSEAPDGSTTVNFGSISYNAVGEYVYTIAENPGNDPSIAYDKRAITATVKVKLNTATNKLFVESVTYTRQTESQKEPLTVTNRYTAPTPASAILKAEKYFCDAVSKAAKNFGNEKFTFELYESNENGDVAADAKALQEVTTSGSDVSQEVLSFAEIRYSDDVAPGETLTKYYLIKEKAGTNASISYSKQKILVKVIISKAIGEGLYNPNANKLTAAATYKLMPEDTEFTDEVKRITNTYTKPGEASIIPEVTKKFVNADGSKKNFGSEVFTFKLYKSDANGTQGELVETKRTTDKNASTQTIRFSARSYTEDRELTEYYLIKEETGTNPSITYDTEGILMKVEVKKVGNTLQATATYKKAGKTGDEAKVITNTYTKPSEISVTPKVTKKLVDADGTPRNFGRDAFTFGLYEATVENGKLTPGKQISTVTTNVKNASEQLLSFASIGYDKDIQVGEKVEQNYIIKEIPGSNISITYDTTEIGYKVVFTKGEDNKLKATEEYITVDGTAIGNPTITNRYTAPTPASAILKAEKYFCDAVSKAAKNFGNEKFTFELYESNENGDVAADAKALQEVTTSGSDVSQEVLSFAEIRYSDDVAPGETLTKYYLIKEKAGTNASISYSKQKILVKVIISKAIGEGLYNPNANKLTAAATYKLMPEDTEFTDEVKRITNTYTKPGEASIIPEVTKKFVNADGSKKNFGSEVFTFKLYKSDANGTQGELVETKRTTDKNASTQTIRFSARSYTEDRELTEYYLIKEETGTNPSITYDTEGILMKVEVKKVGNTLQATASYTKAGESDDKAKVITNEYRLPQEVNVTPQVTKKLENADGTPRNFGDDVFTFELYAAEDENGTLAEGAAPLDTLKTTKADVAQQLLKFKSRTYAKDIEPGDKVTKYYVIKEEQGDNISINYDTTAIVYKVVFEKDATDNKLKATETYTIGGKQTDDPTITNTYKTPTPAETALTVEKYFYDKTAQADKKFGSEVFTFELFKAEEGNGTLAEGATAIDTKQASGADISRQTLTFLTLRHEQDMKPGDSVTEYYLIREKAPTNPSIKCENPEVIAKVVYSKAKAAGAYSDAANKIDVSVSYKMKGETAFAEGRKTVKNLYTEPDAVVPQAPIQVKKAFFDITGGDEAKTAKAIHAGEFSFTITPVGEAPMTGITQTVSTKDAASGTDTISFGNTTYTKEGVYRYLITENAGTNPSVAYDKHVIEVIVTVTKNSENKLVAATEYFVKENAEAAGTKEENPTFENLYTEPTATRFTPEVSKHLVDDASADRAFGNDIFTFNLYKAKADGTIEGAAIDTVSTSAEDKALAVKKLTFHAIELADDLAYGTAKTDFYYVIKEVKGDNPSITYDETAILVHAEVTKNADNKLEVKVTYSRGEESSSAGLEVKNIYTKPQPAKYVIEFTKKYFDITSGTETAKNFGSEIFNFSLYESNENGEQIGEPIDEISTNSRTVSSQDLAFKERVYGEDIEPGQTVTQYYLIKEKKGANYSIGYDTKVILVKVTLTKDKQDADHPNAKNEVIASVEYLKQTNDGFTGTWSGDKQVVRNTYTTPTPVVPESPIQVKKAFFDITGGDEAKTAKEIHAGEFSFTITPVDDAPTTGIIPTVNTRDAASGMDTISFGSTTYTKEGEYHYLITETSGKNPSVTYDKRVIEVVVTVTKTSANKLAAKTEYFVKENAEAAGTLTTNPTFENLYKAPTVTNFVPEVIKHLVDVTSGAEIDRVFGKDSFTFKLYEADAAGTIKGGAIDTVSTGEEDKELVLKKLAFKQIDISKDLEYGTDKTEYFYIIREEAEANPSIQDDVREILVKVTVTKTTDNKLAAKVAYIRGEEQKDTALTVTNRYTEPEPTSFTPEATKKLTGRDLKDGEFIFELLDAEGNVIDTAANAADGKIRFKTLTFKEDADAKDYVYSIREVKGNLSAVIYDKSVYTIKIHVIKNAQNKLEITDVKYVKDEKDVENITFSNTYSPYVPSVVVDITASKQFEGGILNGKDFTFKLEPVNKTEGYVRTAYNEKDGSINFGKFIYFREGVYEYILSEIVGSDRNIGYDKAQIKVTVTVRQDKYKLVADVKYDKNGQETNIFVNKNGIDPDKTSVSLYAQKILQGGELEANDFTFRLTPLNGAPGKSQQVKNTAAGDVVFDNITFTEVGTYRYEIRELQMSSKKNISYDKQKVYAAVRVYRDEYGQLLAEVSYTKNGADTNTFINKSRDDDGKPPVKPDRDSDGKFPQRPDDGTPKTGDEMMFTLWILVCLGAGAGLFAASRKNHKE